MQSSVLHTADVPSFDQKTGQLALASHHLISAPASIVGAYSAGGILLFDPPPAQPYQQRTAVDGDANHEQRKRKRRRTTRALPPDEHSSPADWIRHREREQDRTTTDRESDAHHAGIAPELQNAIEAVQSGHAATEQEGDDDDERWTGVKRGYEWRRSDDADARTELDLVGLASGAAAAALAPEGRLALSDDEASVDAASLIGRVVTNERKSEAKLHLTTAAADPLASLCIPPSSGFLLSDMATWSNPASGIADLGRTKGGWDVLLIDPPWPNVSATRSASYETFDPYDLWKLDVPALLGDKPAVVAVWLTNRVKFRRLVKDKLFPAWRVRNVAEWYWVKIASKTGEPVWPLSAQHRRCYEGLLVGHYIPPNAGESPSRPTIPRRKVFLSTPIGHSRKPFILDLLRPYLVDRSRPPNVLELFARMTLAGSGPTLPSHLVHGTEEEEAVAAEATGAQTEEKQSPAPPCGFFLGVGNEAVKFNVIDRDRAGGVKGWIRVADSSTG
ncbi:hypothetical protein JCM8115_001260 [Rhodotorula mucilaginosa]